MLLAKSISEKTYLYQNLSEMKLISIKTYYEQSVLVAKRIRNKSHR
jgi:hypothetical protein